MIQDAFDHLADLYESTIDWPKRLAHEGPFYRRLLEEIGARSAADVACGAGHHAAMLHGWGLRVEGADLSPQMIERARRNFGEPAGLRWMVRGFDEPIRLEKPFDAAFCVGNSLALAADMAMAELAVRAMLAAVRPGGAVVVHLLNLWRLAAGPCLWQKCIRASVRDRDMLVLKGVHRCGAGGFVDLVVMDPAGGPLVHSESVPLVGIRAADLEHMARTAGASQVDFFGGYRDEPYEAQTSVDLVMVARR